MDISKIITDLKRERERLQKAIDALEALESGKAERPRRGRPPKVQKNAFVATKRHMSSAARKSISAMMKKRWKARKAGDDNWGGPLKKSAREHRAD